MRKAPELSFDLMTTCANVAFWYSVSPLAQHFDSIESQLFEGRATAHRIHTAVRLRTWGRVDRIHVRVSEDNPGSFSGSYLFDKVLISGVIIQNLVINSIQLRVGLLVALASGLIHLALRLTQRASRGIESQRNNESGCPGNEFHFGLLFKYAHSSPDRALP
jgi:hypothetical protein